MDPLQLVKDWFHKGPELANKAAKLYNQITETEDKAFLTHPNGHKIQVLKLEENSITIGIPGYLNGYKTILNRNQIKRFLGMEVKQEEPNFNRTSQQQNNGNPKYFSPDHYKRMTGKRFRMTKDQIQRGLSRNQAFQEFLKTL